MSHIGFVLLYGLGSFFAVLAALKLIPLLSRPAEKRENLHSLVFLLEDSQVIDANFSGQRILDRGDQKLGEFERLQRFLKLHFNDTDVLTSLGPTDVTAQSRDKTLQAIRQVTNTSIRLQIRFVNDTVNEAADIHSLRAMESELETLRANTIAAPFLLWRQNPDGEVIWANESYMTQAREVLGQEETWPLPTLFPSLSSAKCSNASETRRINILPTTDDASAWFDCHISTIGTDLLCSAIAADEAVRAENRRREFTQTLSKTFAELAIGLAIFDRARRLVLFNPAILDLTGLPTDFLMSRPSLVAFLDQLRENRVMPEPRDYRSWRTAIAELESAASDGSYSETWSLPDGQTYHVTGSPHPDGAVALLFEDISAEMSLTRHFRNELEQSQSVIDALDQGVAVFSATGELSLCNQAYRDIWQTSSEDFLSGTINEASRLWHENTVPTPVWGDFREFAASTEDREEWTATVSLLDGRNVFCRFLPQKGGGTMSIFKLVSTGAASQKNLRQAI